MANEKEFNCSCPNCGSTDCVKRGFDAKKRRLVKCVACERCYTEELNRISSPEVEAEVSERTLLETVDKLSASNQKLADTNRIVRAVTRKENRLINALTEMGSKLYTVMKQYDKLIKPERAASKAFDSGAKHVGIVHLSDAHFGEGINIADNVYNFPVASARVKHCIDESEEYFMLKGVKKVVLVLTGDLFNSNRRMDEILNQAASRANSLFLGTKIIEQVILQLSTKFEVHIVSVVGNESRIELDYSNADTLLSDNFDNILFNILRYKFAKTDFIYFHTGDPVELVIEIGGNNFLLMHGNQLGKDVTRTVAEIKGKFATRGVLIDYVLFGHLHQCYSSELFTRSGSICGGNIYSDRSLQLSSRASQCCYIVKEGKKGNITSIKIDLQNCENEGYNLDDLYVEYETKSVGKHYRDNNVIIKTTI